MYKVRSTITTLASNETENEKYNKKWAGLVVAVRGEQWLATLNDTCWVERGQTITLLNQNKAACSSVHILRLSLFVCGHFYKNQFTEVVLASFELTSSKTVVASSNLQFIWGFIVILWTWIRVYHWPSWMMSGDCEWPKKKYASELERKVGVYSITACSFNCFESEIMFNDAALEWKVSLFRATCLVNTLIRQVAVASAPHEMPLFIVR